MPTTASLINWEDEIRAGRLPMRQGDIFMGEPKPYERPTEQILAILRRLLTGIIAGHQTIKTYVLNLIEEPYPEAVYQISEDEKLLILLWWETFDKTHLRKLRADIYKEASGLRSMGEFMIRMEGYIMQ